MAGRSHFGHSAWTAACWTARAQAATESAKLWHLVSSTAGRSAVHRSLLCVDTYLFSDPNTLGPFLHVASAGLHAGSSLCESLLATLLGFCAYE